MKAFLLAAGVGSRLRPITDTIPKCMVPIGDRPLLDIWLDEFARAGVHLPDEVRLHLAGRPGPPMVHTVFEPGLLGSAGTLVANRRWVADEDFFLACNADNLTDFDLRDLMDAHRVGGTAATLTAFHSETPSTGGVIELDDFNRVVGFTEKPADPASDLVNAGMYAFNPEVLDEISQPAPVDIGYYLLPLLVGRARAITVEGYFRDIGTPEAYRLAREEWPARALR
jgi:mannose-1-phosphate guanylyltransferase